MLDSEEHPNLVTNFTAIMNDDNVFTKPRKTLRQSLTDLFRLRIGRTSPRASAVVGSGILRKASPVSAYQLPQFSAVSLFPDFGASDFDIRQYAARNRAREHLPVSTSNRQPRSKPSLLPATSLSQFDLRQAYVTQGEVLPREVVYETVTDGYLSGISRQASLASLSYSTLHRSTSTLRIRGSKPDLRSTTQSPQPTLREASSRRTLRKQGSSISQAAEQRSVRTSGQLSSSSTDRSSMTSTSARRRPRSSLGLVDHFRSFCVLDTAQKGCPVTATSSDLRYIFDVGEPFFLNNQEIEGISMDIVSGVDTAGNAITHLVLFSPLVAPSSGRSRFILASLVDVTPFIYDTATLPELDTISEESSVASFTEVVATPSLKSSPAWKPLSHELSVDDLLGGCSISDGVDNQRTEAAQDDVWLDLAYNESKNKTPVRKRPNSRQSIRGSPRPSSTTSQSSTSSVDDALDTFVSSLQTLYSDFFLLGKSALDESVLEICNCSAKIYEAKEYIDGHLSQSPRETLERLSACLTREAAFTLSINWGTNGEPKQLYCAPLYGQNSLTWICFLVDVQTEMLW